MLTLDEARTVVAEWNSTRADQLYAPWETVQEAIVAFNRWRAAIWFGYPLAATMELLLRHHEFARRIPDELLLLLVEDDVCDDEGT